ncbi:MAG: hypothetical protein KDD51_07430 [Bdellovibrionales bacterium]|nr:hypothetical protein [Bdellovibrionales bacterium]
MRQFLVLLYLLISSTLAVGSLADRFAAAACPSRLVANSSVGVPISRYGQPYARGQNGYFGMLGKEFSSDHQRLLKGANPFHRPVFLDLGAGLSLAGIEWISHGGRTIALSAHDFWDSMDSLIRVGPDDLKFYKNQETQYRLDRARDVGIEALKSASVILGVPFNEGAPLKRSRYLGFSVWRPDADVMAQRVRILSTNLLAKRKFLEDAGIFIRETGMAENLLHRWSGHVDLLADVYGAFFYSVDRRYIIELVYNALAEEGRAYLFYGAKREARYGGPYDRVHTDQGEMDFLDFLVAYAPNIFAEVEGSDPFGTYRVLQIRKDRLTPRLELPLLLDYQRVHWVSSSDGYSFAQRVPYTYSLRNRYLENSSNEICISIPRA